MKKTIFSILGYLFFIQFLSAQITTNEAPFSFGSTPSQLLRSISTQELSAPDMAIIRAENGCKADFFRYKILDQMVAKVLVLELNCLLVSSNSL